MRDCTIFLLVLSIAFIKASDGANLSANLLVHVGQFLTPEDLIGKMAKTCKIWSKVNWRLVYENLTLTNDPIAIFKKIGKEKFFLEDPMKLLDPTTNYLTKDFKRKFDFLTATWKDIFEYSMMGHHFAAEARARLMDENSKQFMKALATSAARNCPLDWKTSCHCTPLKLAAIANEPEAVKMLLQRDRTLVNDADVLKTAISLSNLEVVQVLLENDADINAETLGHRAFEPQAIHEWCAEEFEQDERIYKLNIERWSKNALYKLQRLQKINEMLLHQKENENKNNTCALN